MTPSPSFDPSLTGAGVSSDTPLETGSAAQHGYTASATSVAESRGDRLDAHAPLHQETAHPARAPRRGIPGAVWAVLAVLAILLAAAIVFGILKRAHAEHELESNVVESSIPTVKVIYPSAGHISSELTLPGSAEAYTDTPIYSRTNGYLKQWYFDIGAHVRKGQLMATIETPEVDQQLQVAQADLKSAQANLNLAKTTAARYVALLKSNSVSKQETDEATGAELSRDAAVEAAEAQVRRLQQLQSFEKIYAPFSGIVTARNTDVGDLIVAGQEGSGSGQNQRELFHLAAIDRVRVFVSVPEADSASIQDGARVTLTSDAYPGRIFDGVIARNANAVDPSTRTLNVEVDVPNPQADLLPGAYVFVHFKLPIRGNSVTIPSNTLIFRAQGLRVGVVRRQNGKDVVDLVPVTISHDGGALVEISSGITSSDAIVTDPSDSLTTGQQVNVRNANGNGGGAQ